MYPALLNIFVFWINTVHRMPAFLWLTCNNVDYVNVIGCGGNTMSYACNVIPMSPEQWVE